MYEEGEDVAEEASGVFNPAVDQILWRREKTTEGSNPEELGPLEYYVKFNDFSYLHCEWITEEDILTMGKAGKNKLNRFNRMFEKKVAELEADEDDDTHYFDPSYLEVDKILYCTEIFPVIHPKKANDIRGKWSEHLVQVVSKLLNFSRDDVHYGVYFMEPVDTDRDDCGNYRKVITYQMDLGTINNRLYLDYYKNYQSFWNDLGYVFKNARRYNKDPACDIRILADTLREYARILYKKWHEITVTKCDKMKSEYEERNKEFEEKYTKNRAVIEETVTREFEEKVSEIKRTIVDAQRHARDGNFEMLKNSKFNYVNLITQGLYLFGSQPHLMADIVNDLEKALQSDMKNLEGDMIAVVLAKIDKFTTSVRNEIINRQADSSCRNGMENHLSVDEIENLFPRGFDYEWLRDEKSEFSLDDEEFGYFTPEEIEEIDITFDSDRIYLVKWKNLSYLEATWEPESRLDCPGKIGDFRIFNRALDKESRSSYANQLHRHKNLLEIMSNPKKRVKTPPNTINEWKRRLYMTEHQHQPIVYNQKNQPIFKEKRMLRPYQIDSLNWLIDAWYANRNLILADEMGLGKTIQSLAFLNHLVSHQGMKGPFLVVAPLSTLQHWKRTVEDWSTLNCVLYYDLKGIDGRKACRAYEWFYTDISIKGSVLQTAEICKFHILITSYEVFLQDVNNVLINLPFQHIVIDEAHRLKNQNAKILNALKKLPCKRISLLTGTPIQNNTTELWSLLNFIEPSHFNSLTTFLTQFGDLSKLDQVEKLHVMLKPYLLRRMKEDVESSIPPLQETIIDIEMTTIQKTIYRALYEKNKGILVKSGGIN